MLVYLSCAFTTIKGIASEKRPENQPKVRFLIPNSRYSKFCSICLRKKCPAAVAPTTAVYEYTEAVIKKMICDIRCRALRYDLVYVTECITTKSASPRGVDVDLSREDISMILPMINKAMSYRGGSKQDGRMS